MAFTCEFFSDAISEYKAEIKSYNYKLSLYQEDLLKPNPYLYRSIDNLTQYVVVWKEKINEIQKNIDLLKQQNNCPPALLQELQSAKSQVENILSSGESLIPKLQEAEKIYQQQSEQRLKERQEREEKERKEQEQKQANATKADQSPPAAVPNQTQSTDPATPAVPSTAATEPAPTTVPGPANDDESTNATAELNQIDPGLEKLIEEAQANGQEVPASEDAPGRRMYNPLSKFASYTYQITLYMITPDAYDAFVSSGRRNINILNNASNTGAGAYIIAQSGGVNSTTSQRAPGFGLDIYIDDLQIDQAINGQATQTSTNVTNLRFSVVEPYGFSFISNLRRAADALKEYSKNLGKDKLQNPLRQLYILGLRFHGYDIHGNLVTEIKNYDGTVNKSQDGFFETFYDIVITGIKFKLDGKAVRYNIEARSAPPQAAFGAKRGILNNTTPIQASTVRTALIGPNGLITRMNKEQEDMKAAGKIGEINNYSVEFLGDSAALQNASIVSPADLDKYRWSGSGTQNSAQVNDASAATTVPNPTQRQITFASGTTIMSAIQQIVTQSSYLEDALKIVYTTNLQPEAGKKDQPVTQNSTDTTVRWYTLNAKLSNARYDETVGDFAYDITYLIQPYDTPVIRQTYSNPGKKYYGPHKRYEYWFTGQNSEILRYEQQFDALYYNAVLGNPKAKTYEDTLTQEVDTTGQGGAAGVPQAPGQRQPRPRLGKLNVGMEAQNAYLTDLYDPAGLVKVKVSILGDPDYLVQEQASSLDAVYSKFYGTDRFTINPNGGQVFFEIDFKEGVDYNHKDGLFTINDQIRFWKYPQEIEKKIKGIAYVLISVKSKFSGGSFTQELEAVAATFDDALEQKGTGREQERENTSATSPTPTGTATTASTGTRIDPPPPGQGVAPANTQPATSGAGLVSGSQQSSIQISTNTTQVTGGTSTIRVSRSLEEELEEVTPVNSLTEVTVTSRRQNQIVADDDGSPAAGLGLSGNESEKNREDGQERLSNFNPRFSI